ncbi:MAG: nucleotidyltransferase domain-containing protein [Parafilimonas sp.]|nr:nucleotidyltransferase domain-containing protein [Parafilimonas sp.]
MQSLDISILKTLTYFDIFSYPLNQDEIIFFLDKPATNGSISSSFDRLVKAKLLCKFDNFYSIRNAAELIKRRNDGNALAVIQIKKARKVSRFLSWIPYVKGIAISGSLSKNFADENSDLDFFIITKANRLWIVRIIYSFIYKIASTLRIKEWFCLNYFIDESELEIKEHNLFTAVELSTLMPLKGEKIFDDFFNANSWVNQFQPNFKPCYEYMNDASPTILKRTIEWTMNNKCGDKLDARLHLFFKKRFERMTMENKQSEKGLTIGAYKADKHACKPLPQYFQPKILMKFQERFKIVEAKYYQVINKEKALVQNA